jgi:hypothetical protein
MTATATSIATVRFAWSDDPGEDLFGCKETSSERRRDFFSVFYFEGISPDLAFFLVCKNNCIWIGMYMDRYVYG